VHLFSKIRGVIPTELRLAKKGYAMTRFASAAAIAAALASVAAFDAAAAPLTNTLFTRPVACAVNKSDGEALKIRILVTNTTGQTIKQGTPITLTIRYRTGGPELRTLTIKQDLTVYRDVYAGNVIGFDQPTGSLSCTGRVSMGIDKSRLTPHKLTH
jgi:hypothetical protein